LSDIHNLEKKPKWLEIVPENWMHLPRVHKKDFEKTIRDYNIACHGISLSIGSPQGINLQFLKEMKEFLDRYDIKYYSEHMSFSSMNGKQSYDLLPLPLTKKVADRIVENIDIVQNYLKRNLVLENATYYYVPESELSEVEFINMIVKKSGGKILLDINNTFVNSHNHNYDPYKFIDQMPMDSVAYYHMAGHLEDDESGLWVDTHGNDIKTEVMDLLKYALLKQKAPVLLERDNNIPPLKTLMKEYHSLQKIYDEC
jgi:uncharacterized protein (UPF0276 family)